MQIGLLALAFAHCAAGTMRSLDASRAATAVGTQRDAAEFSYPIPIGHRWVTEMHSVIAMSRHPDVDWRMLAERA